MERHKSDAIDVVGLEFVLQRTEKQGKHVFQDSPCSSSEIRKMYLWKVSVYCVDTPCVLVFWWIYTDAGRETSTYVDMETKPTHAYECRSVSDITHTVCLLHVAATLVAIFREVIYKGRIYRDVTSVVAATRRRHTIFII